MHAIRDSPCPQVDPDIADVNRLVWTWTNPVNDASGVPVFAIDPANGNLTVNGLVNFEVSACRPAHCLGQVSPSP
jgi:hypothetical protein